MNGTSLRDTPSFSPNVPDPGGELAAPPMSTAPDTRLDLLVSAGVIDAWLMNGGVRPGKLWVPA